MAQFELNIYGSNDEILKTYETDHVRFGVLIETVKLQEKIKAMSEVEQFEIIVPLMKKIFPDLTDEDLDKADYEDVFSTFGQLMRKAEKIGNNSNSKNSTGATAK